MNPYSARTLRTGSFLAGELQRWKTGEIDCGPPDMAIHVRRIVLEEEKKSTLNHERDLPTRAGFYWWRPSKDRSWSMLHVKNFGSDNPKHLSVDDLSTSDFTGLTLGCWDIRFPVGEWVETEPPLA